MHRLPAATLIIALLSTVVSAAEHTKDSTATIKKNLKEGRAVIIDVREKKEWDAGHLKDAHLMPLGRITAGVHPKEVVKDLKPETIIYCHCAVGRRALVAADALEKLGYDARPLKLGYKDLVELGLPKAE